MDLFRKVNLERLAPAIAMSVAFFLAVIKFIIGILSGSVVLLSSAVDSLLDTGVSIFNYFAIKFSQIPPDKEHLYGHGKIEGIAAIIEGTIITISGLYIIYESVNKILNPEPISYFDWTIIVMFISIITTLGLVLFLNYVYKKTNNLVIKGDSLHYKMDLFTNLAVIITLIIVYFLPGFSWIDGVVGFLIGLYIIHEAWQLIQDGVGLLLDKALPETEKVKQIIEKFVKEGKIKSYHCFKTRMGSSKDKFVEFHFVMDPNITILQAHNVGDEIENEIKKLDLNSKWNVIWHVDPYDDSKNNLCFS